MSRAVEYLDEAIDEAAAAARWYAERSSAAALGFADEIDAAIVAIEQNPEAWPLYDHATRHFLLRRYPFSVVLSRRGDEDPGRRRGPWTSTAWILGFAAAEPAWLTREWSRRPRPARACLRARLIRRR